MHHDENYTSANDNNIPKNTKRNLVSTILMHFHAIMVSKVTGDPR